MPIHVDRPHLLADVEAQIWKVVAIKAPGGFGKTTLLADLGRHKRKQGAIAAWLTADEDDTAASLGHYLLHALESAGLPLAASTAANGNPLSSLLEAVGACGLPCLLIVDGLESMAPGAVGSLNQLIHRAPSNLSMALGFRRNPGLDLSSLMLDGRGIEFNADWLRFSKLEVSACFGGSLSSRELDQLTERSEGWAAALSLHRQSRERENGSESTRIAPQGPIGASGVAAEWVGSRLLGGLRGEDLSLLLKAAQFDVIDPDLLTEVLKEGDALQRLLALDDLQGLVQPVGGESQAFRLNSLVREHCCARLRLSHPDQHRELHHSIAKALARRGQLVAAARHAHAAGDAALYGACLVKAGGLRLYLSDGMASLSLLGDALGGLNEEVTNLHPRLAMLRCRLLMRRSKMPEARLLYERCRVQTANFTRDPAGGDLDALVADSRYIRALLTGYGCLPFGDGIINELIETHLLLKGEERPDLRIVNGYAVLIFAAYAGTGMFELAMPYGKEAEAAALRLEAPHAIFHVNLILGLAAMARGRPSEAQRHYATAARIAKERSSGNADMRQAANVLLAELDLLRNRLGELPQRASAISVPFKASTAWHEIIAATHEVVSEWRAETGGVQSALSALWDWSDALGLHRSLRHLSALRVSHLVRDGRPDAAQQEWSTAGLPDQHEELLNLNRQNWREMEALACARLRLLIASNRLESARELASGLSALAEERGLARTLMRCLALSMALEHQAGHPNAASAHLLAFLRLLEETGYCGLMLREPAACRILPEVAAQAAFDADLRKSANALLREHARTANPLPPEFSERERQILKLLAEGLRDKEIARRLALSEHGVRYHLKNVFRKTGTRGRAATAQWAASRGIVC